MFKYVLQLIIGVSILALSTVCAWYEGSTITDIPWEWRYSTPFSDFFKIEIVNGQEISQLDYFVYAAKYQPFFPAIMLISIIYIFNVAGHFLLAYKAKRGLIYFALISCMFLVGSLFVFNASTVGGRVFFWITLIGAVLSVAATVYSFFKYSKWKQMHCNAQEAMKVE